MASGRSWRRDHPRSRGVYRNKIWTNPLAIGSSPLARGLRMSVCSRYLTSRIIPARAGFTFHLGVLYLVAGDHPRSRGVYHTHYSRSLLGPGSSPLARGLQWHRRLPTSTQWIIPARAGFTRPGHSQRDRRADHPRSRGVYSRPDLDVAVPGGSSPLARGLRRWSRTLINRSGIIPARAGFTCTAPHRRSRGKDHPRSRGVYRGRGSV